MKRRALIHLMASYLLLAVCYYIWSCYTHAALERELDDFHSQGLPMTIADVTPDPIPDENNAAIILQQAFSLLESAKPNCSTFTKSIEKLASHPPTETLQTLSHDNISRILATSEFKQLFAILHQAAQLPRCQFIIDRSPGADFPSYYMPARKAITLLCLHAHLQADRGELTSSLTSLVDASKLGACMAEDQLMISFLATAAHERRIAAQIPAILSKSSPDAQSVSSLRLLKSQFHRYRTEAKDALLVGFDHDRITHSDFIAQSIQGQLSDWPMRLGWSLFQPVWRIDQRITLEYQQQYRVVASLPVSTMIDIHVDLSQAPMLAFWTKIYLGIYDNFLQKRAL